MTELHLYVGHGYFNAFCTCIHKLLRDKVHYAFSSAYSIDPSAAITEPHVIPKELGYIEGDNNIYHWYYPAAVDTSEPSRKVTWNKSTKPPAIDQSIAGDLVLSFQVTFLLGSGVSSAYGQ